MTRQERIATAGPGEALNDTTREDSDGRTGRAGACAATRLRGTQACWCKHTDNGQTRHGLHRSDMARLILVKHPREKASISDGDTGHWSKQKR